MIFTGHFCQNSMEIVLIFIVNQTIMEDSLTFMAKESKYLYLFSYCSWITLEDTCLKKKKKKKNSTFTEYIALIKLNRSSLSPSLSPHYQQWWIYTHDKSDPFFWKQNRDVLSDQIFFLVLWCFFNWTYEVVRLHSVSNVHLFSHCLAVCYVRSVLFYIFSSTNSPPHPTFTQFSKRQFALLSSPMLGPHQNVPGPSGFYSNYPEYSLY